ncbi:MAG: PaaI family thioesterase [Pseudomonadota bacterium]
MASDPFHRFFKRGIPFNDHLGIRFEEETEAGLCYRMPVHEGLVGDPESGALFGAVLFALLDYALGSACGLKVAPASAVATIDLRIDYTRPNEPGRDIFAEGICYRLTRDVAFARGTAFHKGPGPGDRRLLASAQGTFTIYDTPPEWLQDPAA